LKVTTRAWRKNQFRQRRRRRHPPTGFSQLGLSEGEANTNLSAIERHDLKLES
jgi:hypothetical protein